MVTNVCAFRSVLLLRWIRELRASHALLRLPLRKCRAGRTCFLYVLYVEQEMVAHSHRMHSHVCT
jgi:hypothetical protein